MKIIIKALQKTFSELSFDICKDCIYYKGNSEICKTKSGLCEWTPNNDFIILFLKKFLNNLKESRKWKV